MINIDIIKFCFVYAVKSYVFVSEAASQVCFISRIEGNDVHLTSEKKT